MTFSFQSLECPDKIKEFENSRMTVAIKEEKVDSVVSNKEGLDVSGQRYRLIIETFDCCPQVLLFLVSFQGREVSDCEEAHTKRA